MLPRSSFIPVTEKTMSTAERGSDSDNVERTFGLPMLDKQAKRTQTTQMVRRVYSISFVAPPLSS